MKEVVLPSGATVPQVVKMLFPEAEGSVHQGVQFDFLRRWHPTSPSVILSGVELRLRRYVPGHRIFRRVMLSEVVKAGKAAERAMQRRVDTRRRALVAEMRDLLAQPVEEV